MSLLPMESRLISAITPEEARSLNREPYEVTDGRPCAVPGCTKVATDGHHLWRRSFLAGAYDWVAIDELGGLVAPNKVGLCHDHHMELDSAINGQKAWIVGVPTDGAFADRPDVDVFVQFFWITRAQYEASDASDIYVAAVLDGAPLDPQPGPASALGAPRSATESSEPMQQAVDGDEVPHAHVVNEQGEEVQCDKCKGRGRYVKRPKRGREQAPARAKTTWSVRVPKDERENGYEVLDTNLENVVDTLADAGLIRDRNKGANYYSLVYVLAFFQQNFDPVAFARDQETT